MPTTDLASRALRAAAVFRAQGITQKEVASWFGASQSQVSRILAGQSVSRSKLAERVCIYAETLEGGVSVDAVKGNLELLEAVRQAWDGSATHARALSTVIRSLAVLGRPVPSREGEM